MEESIELASQLGSKAVVIHPGRVNADRGQSFEKMLETLRHLSAFASDRGVMLGLENKEGTDQDLCCAYSELLRAVIEVDSPALGITLDVGHANLTCRGDQGSLRHFVRQVAEHVIHVHVHDNYGSPGGEYNGDLHMAPGSCSIDYSVLQELGDFKGIYNLEVFCLEDIIEGKRTLGKYI
jgi:sugar phosphate isomerase/epimerase